MGSNKQGFLQSKADQTMRVSKSVYVSNFPDGSTSKDLWKVCNDYGTVVDVFIPNKKSKVGKRFAFVRFIKVDNLDRLIQNLNTIWIGRFHLFANPVRFERPNKPTLNTNNNADAHNLSRGNEKVKVHVQQGSFANIVSGQPPVGVYGPSISSSPAMMLDESCVIDCDLSKNFMGKVKDVSLISKLRTLFMDEGFTVGQLLYLGGMWVMIECVNAESKVKMMRHSGVKSWFSTIRNATLDFVSDECIVWVDIEGIPLNVWSRETFKRIGKKWGDVMDIEDNVDYSFGRKRLCIKTKQPSSILESFKVIFKGKIFMVRAKELFTWSPIFSGQNEGNEISDDESEMGFKQDSECSQFRILRKQPDGVSKAANPSLSRPSGSTPGEHKAPKDNNQTEKEATDFNAASPSLSHPPGFTQGEPETPNDNIQTEKEATVAVSAKVMKISQEVSNQDSGCNLGSYTEKNGGYVLRVMEDLIKVGKDMGYSMDGCEKDVEHIIGLQGDGGVEAVGLSGGILCVWEATVFKKDCVTTFDNFIAVYGTWLPTNTKVLFVAIYAPQQIGCKRLLWDYVSSLIDRWNGEVVVLGDFNEVRVKEERRGSGFNATSARVFDQFITGSGLVDVKMEGYAFTWTHPSGSKMSKLD
ncbi:RNA-directed DNA polymerase, eukaryota, partial [Tanacetum coccineum]